MVAKFKPVLLIAVLAGILAFMPMNSWGHCDGLDGPVVLAAKTALETKDVNHVLIWVQPAYEQEIQAAFNETLSVRSLSTEAGALVDRYFFETVVRIHRAGEGAPYTGLKPAGRDLGPAIPAADKALETESIQKVEQLLAGKMEAGLEEVYRETMERKDFATDDLEAGRAFIETYVRYIHYVERLYEAMSLDVEGHYSEDH